MRLTIVDKQMAVVEDVFQVATLTPETFAMLVEYALGHYSHSGFRWFVSPFDQQPAHTRHDEFGRIY